MKAGNKKIVLVTGPPNNGRDEYLRKALPKLNKIKKSGYYHIFKFMQEVSNKYGIPNLTRENVFDISKTTLDQIRDNAFSIVINEIKKSDNEIEIISTPAVFKVPYERDYFTGTVDGITLYHIESINPSNIIVFIDDLLRVRENIKKDPLREGMHLELKDLADWRESSIRIVQEYIENHKFLNWVIFAKEHPVDTFVDLLVGEKPWIYLSYHITGVESFQNIERFLKKLSTHFVCIDPYTIKDWDIVKAFDRMVEAGKKNNLSINVNFESGLAQFHNIPIREIEEAIDLIRTQIVSRDLLLIANVHATVVYHKANIPSYGVMVEVFHSNNMSKPVYVLYPFKTRPSPFFENYVSSENIIRGSEAIEVLENRLVKKLKHDYTNNLWPTRRFLK